MAFDGRRRVIMGPYDAERQLAAAEAYYQIETIHLAMGPLAGTSALLLPPPMSGNSLASFALIL